MNTKNMAPHAPPCAGEGLASTQLYLFLLPIVPTRQLICITIEELFY